MFYYPNKLISKISFTFFLYVFIFSKFIFCQHPTLKKLSNKCKCKNEQKKKTLLITVRLALYLLCFTRVRILFSCVHVCRSSIHVSAASLAGLMYAAVLLICSEWIEEHSSAAAPLANYAPNHLETYRDPQVPPSLPPGPAGPKRKTLFLPLSLRAWLFFVLLFVRMLTCFDDPRALGRREAFLHEKPGRAERHLHQHEAEEESTWLRLHGGWR